jgi:Kef-type K+ transport system membrane component KefB
VTAQDVIQTVAIMLGVGLVSKLIADLARLPQMLVLLGAGALIGPAALDAIDVPLDSAPSWF